MSLASGTHRRVLVTGGAGFIGASLVRALERDGTRVRVLDDGRAAGFGHLRGTAAELIAVDLLSADLAAALVDVKAVVHLAGQTGIGASLEDPETDLRENVVGTLRLLEAARAAKVDRFVLASSAAVLGLGAVPATEQAVPRPAVPYGAAKLAAEAYVGAYHHAFGLCTTSIRFANAYGPFAEHKRSVVPAFVRRALCGEPLSVHGDGTQTRDFVHVADLVQIVTRVLDAPAEAVAGEIFHAGSGRETSIAELADVVLRASGGGTVEHLPARHGDVARSALDISRARSVLAYEPTVTLEAGIATSVAWFREQGQPQRRS